MKVIKFFEHEGFEYQIAHLETQFAVQLWFKYPGDTRWELGHEKDIPLGENASYVAATMRAFIVGELDHDEYNRLLPS